MGGMSWKEGGPNLPEVGEAFLGGNSLKETEEVIGREGVRRRELLQQLSTQGGTGWLLKQAQHFRNTENLMSNEI